MEETWLDKTDTEQCSWAKNYINEKWFAQFTPHHYSPNDYDYVMSAISELKSKPGFHLKINRIKGAWRSIKSRRMSAKNTHRMTISLTVETLRELELLRKQHHCADNNRILELLINDKYDKIREEIKAEKDEKAQQKARSAEIKLKSLAAKEGAKAHNSAYIHVRKVKNIQVELSETKVMLDVN